MMYQISEWKSARVFLSSVMVTLLLIGPVLFAPAPGSDGEGVAWAGKLDKRGGGKAANRGRGGGKRTMPQKSKIDRKPRASSASQGSMKKASRERPRAQQQAKARPQAKPQAKAKPRPSGSASSSCLLRTAWFHHPVMS